MPNIKSKRMSRVLTIVLSVIWISTLSEAFDGKRDNVFTERLEMDSAGRNWELKDWEESTRPYPKAIREREIAYKKRWGEVWYGSLTGQRIYSPGNWQWEVVVTVPQNVAAKFKRTNKENVHSWGNRRKIGVFAFVWAPGGEQVTDIYVQSEYFIYHYDLLSKTDMIIGNPREGGNRDGDMENALMLTERTTTLDTITGRVYFIQDRRLRYIEKLLPYECSRTNKIIYLPAVLDWNMLYNKVKSPFGGQLSPAIKDGNRGKPLFVVRTNTVLNTFYLPGGRSGKQPLITPDGKGIYIVRERQGGKFFDTFTNYEKSALFDIATGKEIAKLTLRDEVPRNNWNGELRWASDGPGTHGGSNVGYDNKIYNSQHGGAGGGSGRMFSITPDTGRINMLYDSMLENGTWYKRRSPVIDGPADAKTLNFTSTMWQIQCPRTGAIINGGWDNSGIRRYHDGFVTTIAGHNFGEFHKPARPGWSDEFKNVHGNSNPSVAPNGDLYIADISSSQARIIRIFRTDWPKEQPVNGYAEQFMQKDEKEALMLEYVERYIENFTENNNILGQKR